MSEGWKKGIGISLALAGILLALSRCSKQEQEFEPESNIFAVMDVQDLGQGWIPLDILVEKTYSIEDTLDEYFEYLEYVEGVSDAEVFIYWPGDTAFLEEHYNSGHYFYRPEHSWQIDSINDTSLYTLEVHLPWGDTVTGRSYMPTPLEMIWPETTSLETISISAELGNPHLICWNSCRNVSKYLIYCELPYVSYGDFYPIPSYTTDTTYAFFAERYIWPWFYDREYELTVVGITKEYEDYLNQQHPGKSNLSSGYGVFTGITYSIRFIYIVK